MEITRIDTYLKLPIVTEWINSFSSGRTRKNYTLELPRFLKWLEEKGIDNHPNKIIESRKTQLSSEDLLERGYWETIVNDYKKHLESQGYTQNSIKTYRRAVQSFFSFYRMPLRFTQKERKIRSKKTVKIKTIPSNSELRAMYHRDDVMDRALLTVTYHSGLSGIDISQLRIEDLPGLYKEDGTVGYDDHLYLVKERNKSGCFQQTFLSTEALYALDAYLSNRGYPKEGHLFISESNFSSNTVLQPKYMHRRIKALALKALGEEAGKRIKFKSFRDSFHDAINRALSISGENSIKDRFMGHTSDNSSDVYAVSETTMREAYHKVFKIININGDRMVRDELEKAYHRIEALGKDVYDLKMTTGFLESYIEGLKDENHDLKLDVKDLREAFENLKKLVG